MQIVAMDDQVTVQIRLADSFLLLGFEGPKGDGQVVSRDPGAFIPAQRGFRDAGTCRDGDPSYSEIIALICSDFHISGVSSGKRRFHMGKDLTQRIHDLAGIDGTIPTTVFTPASVHAEGMQDDVKIRLDGDQIFVGYITHDDGSGDYFENDEGAGLYRELKRGDDPNELMENITKSGKIAFFVERYQHGLVHYSVANTGSYPDRQWDVGVCGIHTPCQDVQNEYRKLLASRGEEQARAYAVQDVNRTLDEYSKVCNGETYGVIVETWNIEGQHVRRMAREDVWGFIGSEYALEELEDMFPKEEDLQPTL